MSPLMVSEMTLGSKALSAVFVVAHIWFLSSMDPGMGLKVSFISESLSASLALMGLLTSMRP